MRENLLEPLGMEGGIRTTIHKKMKFGVNNGSS